MQKKERDCIASIGEGVEQLEFSYITSKDINWFKHFGKVFSSIYNPTPQYLPRRNMCIYSLKDLCKNVYSSFIHKRQKETTQMPINSRMDKLWYNYTMEYMQR